MKDWSKTIQVGGLALLLGLSGCSNIPAQNTCNSYQIKRDLEKIREENNIGIHVKTLSCDRYSIVYDSNGDINDGEQIPEEIKPKFYELIDKYKTERREREERILRSPFLNF